MKNKTFISSVRCALNGLFLALEQEKNFKAYLLHILLTVPLNIYCQYTAMEWVAYIICVCVVFATECANTAVERLCDFLTEEHNDKIKVVKDMAAGAVICARFAFYLTEIILVCSHLLCGC